MARYTDDKLVVAMVYPAERDADSQCVVARGGYKTSGPAEGGIGAVERYYRDGPEILETHQLFETDDNVSRTGRELLESVALAVQR